MMKCSCHQRSPSGFTLLELVLTISLIMLVALMVGPKLMNAYPRVNLKSEGIRLRSDLTYAQQLAITHNRSYRVRFKASLNTVTIYRVEIPLPPALVSERTLPNGTKIAGSSFSLGYVEFNGLGEPSEGGNVVLVSSKGTTLSVIVSPGTGHVTLVP